MHGTSAALSAGFESASTADAISGARLKGLPFTWGNLAPSLPLACTPAIEHVNEISQSGTRSPRRAALNHRKICW